MVWVILMNHLPASWRQIINFYSVFCLCWSSIFLVCWFIVKCSATLNWWLTIHDSYQGSKINIESYDIIWLILYESYNMIVFTYIIASAASSTTATTTTWPTARSITATSWWAWSVATSRWRHFATETSISNTTRWTEIAIFVLATLKQKMYRWAQITCEVKYLW